MEKSMMERWRNKSMGDVTFRFRSERSAAFPWKCQKIQISLLNILHLIENVIKKVKMAQMIDICHSQVLQENPFLQVFQANPVKKYTNTDISQEKLE